VQRRQCADRAVHAGGQRRLIGRTDERLAIGRSRQVEVSGDRLVDDVGTTPRRVRPVVTERRDAYVHRIGRGIVGKCSRRALVIRRDHDVGATQPRRRGRIVGAQAAP
jgi:hypothetical protein